MSLIEILFIGVGTLSVGFAVGMLLTEKAVHSALFLIANFVCVALIYLMMDAPFLAMVQIAVYAGAIMVLFLFVIMLLGAENPSSQPKTFKWLTPTTLALSVGFLGIIALTLLGSNIDSKTTEPTTAKVRFVNALPLYPNADFYLDAQPIMQGIRFAEADGKKALRFQDVAPGTYRVGVALADAPRVIPIGQVTISAGETLTLIAYGAQGTDVLPTILTVNEDVSPVSSKIGRLTIANVHVPARPISIFDAGADLLLSADEAAGTPIVSALPLGGFISMDNELPGGRNWVIADANQPTQFFTRILGSGGGNFEVLEGTSQLLVYATDRQGEFSAPIAITVLTPHDYPFGSPQALGQLLFIDYVLPFQLVGILLLTSMVGAIVVAQRTVSKPKPGRPTRRKVSRPLTSVITSQTGTDVTQGGAEDLKLPAPEAEITEPVGD